MSELDFYEKAKNWDFSHINMYEDCMTDWDYYGELYDHATEESRILDLGTGGGENVLKHFPKVKEIIGTDFSEEMINTANENLKKSGKENIAFRVMDNLNMDVEPESFDIITARHTIIDAKGIYKALKQGGYLILRGVDKLDCWSLKRLFGKGQAFNDPKPISLIDYEDLLDAGFKHVELIPIHMREYYKTKEDLMMLLYKAPILTDFSEVDGMKEVIPNIDETLIDKYIEENTTDKGILLIRRYYGIVAQK